MRFEATADSDDLIRLRVISQDMDDDCALGQLIGALWIASPRRYSTHHPTDREPGEPLSLEILVVPNSAPADNLPTISFRDHKEMGVEL